ncbi:MAG: nicotinate (nicotinamide) nucleotide adenylyltransferase [Firmicutes bacterium]|nr:nicotinate (nicotinamide) nucleotide adenylyltransferase [Bacillota bacterium]
MKIGIFGGSFNPPHQMHYQFVQELLRCHLLDKIVIVPTGRNYPKTALISPEHRIAMLKCMFPENSNVIISDYEVNYELTYTYQTLDYFQTQNPFAELYFICGSDNLKELNTWKNAEYMMERYHFLVVPRNGDNVEELMNLYPEYQNHIHIIPISLAPISSSQIRELIANGFDYKNLVTKEVYDYIQKNHLYQS